MNCSLCHTQLSSFIEGKVSSEMKELIKEHLTECVNCANEYASLLVIEVYIHNEKKLAPDFFQPSRIMSYIESIEESKFQTGYKRILRPVLITLAISAAIFIGIMAGNIYNTSEKKLQIPEELVLLNDAGIESLSAFNN